MFQRARRRTITLSSAGALVAFLVSGCPSKSPAELATLSAVQVTDGFRNRGGTAFDGDHIVTDIDLTKGADLLKVVTSDGKTRDANVLYRDADRGIAVLKVKGGGLEGASLGDSGALKVGDPVTAFVYDKDGKGSALTAKFTGFRASQKRAYLETDLVVDENVEGAGIFDRSGQLVGIMQFKLTPKLNYALPIEYAVSEKGAIGQPLIRHPSSQAFVQQRDAAASVDKAIEAPLDFGKLDNVYSYSRSALIGKLVMLDDPSAGSHNKPVAFRMTATNATRAVRTIAEGKLETPLTQWFAYPADKVDAKRDELSKSFGDAYVRDSFSVYQYGELRYRIPFKLFCKEVTAEEVHNVNLTLADGRTTGDFGFADLVNVCAAQEDGDGSVWEREWGMGEGMKPGEPATPAAAGAKSKTKVKATKVKVKTKTKKRTR
ncbi:MAG: serine protease [Myxococcota bacterium]|nr:serine protease [Myxococcota bacterium]